MNYRDHVTEVMEELTGEDDPMEPKGPAEPVSKHAKGWRPSPHAARKRDMRRRMEKETRKKNRKRG